jgi:hypothetical protein
MEYWNDGIAEKWVIIGLNLIFSIIEIDIFLF